MTPCEMVDGYKNFRGIQYPVLQGLRLEIEATGSSEMSVHTWQSTRRYDPEDKNTNFQSA